MGVLRRRAPRSRPRKAVERLDACEENRTDRVTESRLARPCERVVPMDELFPIVMLSEGRASEGRSSAVEASLYPYDCRKAAKPSRVHHGQSLVGHSLMGNNRTLRHLESLHRQKRNASAADRDASTTDYRPSDDSSPLSMTGGRFVNRICSSILTWRR